MTYLSPAEVIAAAKRPNGLNNPAVYLTLVFLVHQCVRRQWKLLPRHVQEDIEVEAIVRLVLISIPRFNLRRHRHAHAFIRGNVSRVGQECYRRHKKNSKGRIPLELVAADLGYESRAEHPDSEMLEQDGHRLMILYRIAGRSQRRMLDYFKLGWSRPKIAETLGVPRNRIDQWVCRLRRRTEEVLATEYPG